MRGLPLCTSWGRCFKSGNIYFLSVCVCVCVCACVCVCCMNAEHMMHTSTCVTARMHAFVCKVISLFIRIKCLFTCLSCKINWQLFFSAGLMTCFMDGLLCNYITCPMHIPHEAGPVGGLSAWLLPVWLIISCFSCSFAGTTLRRMSVNCCW